MTLANAVLVVIWAGVTAYGILGGADFGAGFWDLFAGSARKGGPVRTFLEHTIGPVWEANHVWLIFVLVFLWTAFPEPFVSIATTMYIPLTLSALGIILRGSSFAFRKWAATLNRQRALGLTFALSSILTPFFLGTIAGGVASGRVPLGNAAGDPVTSWLNPTSILGGVMAVGATAFIAAVFSCRDAAAIADATLTGYFKTRAMVTGVAVGVVAVAGIGVLAVDAPELFDGLVSLRGVPLMAGSATGGLLTLWLVRQERFGPARVAAVLATATVLWGWGAAQYPNLLEPNITVSGYASSNAVLIALLGAFALAGLLAVPALGFLFTLVERGVLGEAGDHATESTASLLATLVDEPEA
ncbi:MAG: cytochrome d ubiquinol oxidase subunit II [Acidimicrobiia bacterium]